MMRVLLSIVLALFCFGFQFNGLDDGSEFPAERITVKTDQFDGNLSVLDTDVQKALETLDEMTGGTGDSFWKETGTNLYPDTLTNNVGIGTSVASTKLHVLGVISATGGTSTEWNTAYGWGDHASEGYLTTETDPKVGILSQNKLTKWGTTTLVDSQIYDNGTNVGVGTTVPVNKFEVAGDAVLSNAGTAPMFGMRDTDVTHGVTTLAHTNSFYRVSETNTTKGGVQIYGFSDGTDNPALELRGVNVNDPDTNIPAIILDGYAANGTGLTALAATKTVLSVQNNGTEYIKVLGNGNTTFTGTVTGSNISGTNTGDAAANTTYSGLDFLVGTATTALSGEIVVGTTPGGELGGTWANPTIDDGITVANMVLTTPNIGVSTATSINKVTITSPASSATLTIADGKTLTATNTVNLNSMTDTKYCTYSASGTQINCTAEGGSGGSGITGLTAGKITKASSATTIVDSAIYENGGNVGIGTTVPTSRLTLATGTTASGTSPLKFISGSLMTVPETGALEFLTDNYYATITAVSSYSSKYPPAYNTTYVKATSETYHNAYDSTDPSKSLTGANTTQWGTPGTNQRFHIDLGSAFVVTRVYYENGHHIGLETNAGVRNFTLWGSNSGTAFSTLTYATDTDWTQLTTDVSAFVQHPASDVADPHYVAVTNSTAYRYYAFKFADAWGGAYMSLRRVELQTSGEPIRTSIVVDDGARLTAGRIPYTSTNGRLADSSTFVFVGTNVGIGTTAPQAKLTVTGGVYVSGDVSALTFTDRTPFYSGDALAEIKKIKGNEEIGIDHETIPVFAKGTYSEGGELKEGRDLGAMISMLVTAVQQLNERVDQLNKTNVKWNNPRNTSDKKKLKTEPIEEREVIVDESIYSPVVDGVIYK